MSTRTRVFTAVAAVASAGTVAAVIAAVPSSADGATVTRGEFAPFSVGTGLPVSGRAQMVRTADGKTIVSVHLQGLDAGATYAVHVHAGDCATNAGGGGHYFFPGAVPGGAGPAGNEIWPGPVTADDGGTANGNAKVDATAGPTAMAVVVHRSTATPNKIACADLG